MKTLIGKLLLCVLAAAPAVTAETPSAPVAPIQISDVPRHTQIGDPPAPNGAPGNGKYFPPAPANSKLPTLWLIGDSTVRNGTLGDGSNMNQWGWGAPIVACFDLDKINVVIGRDPAARDRQRERALHSKGRKARSRRGGGEGDFGGDSGEKRLSRVQGVLFLAAINQGKHECPRLCPSG